MKLKLLSAYTVITTGDDQVSLICCSCVELFGKLYDVYSVLSKLHWKPLTGVNCLFCTFIISHFQLVCQS